jgi:hypothetical protein
MAETIFNDIAGWAKKHGLKIDIEQIQDSNICDRYELDSALVFALSPSGFVSFLEQGFTPEGYLPDLIKSYLALITEAGVELESLTTDDDWMNATAVLLKNGIKTEIFIEEVNQGDWVPTCLPDQLEQYSKNNCQKVLYTIVGEDPFVVLYLSTEAIEELEKIRKQLPLPEIN